MNKSDLYQLHMETKLVKIFKRNHTFISDVSEKNINMLKRCYEFWEKITVESEMSRKFTESPLNCQPYVIEKIFRNIKQYFV